MANFTLLNYGIFFVIIFCIFNFTYGGLTKTKENANDLNKAGSLAAAHAGEAVGVIITTAETSETLVNPDKNNVKYSHKTDNFNVINVRHDPGSTMKNLRNPVSSTRAQGVISAIIAWLIITTFGFSGLILIPLKKYKTTYCFILQFLTAMGFSSLTGDVVFHLIPHGLLSHEPHDHTPDPNKPHDPANEQHGHDCNYGKLAILLFGLIFLYFVEIILKIIPFTRKRECGCHVNDDVKEEKKDHTILNSQDYNDDNSHGHKHSFSSDHKHIHYPDDHKHHDCVNIEAARDIKLTSTKHRLGAGVPPDITASLNRNQIEVCPADEDEINQVVVDITSPDCSTAKEAKNVVLVLLFADMCHHVLDGLAIGAIFVQDSKDSFSNGISFSLAVFFHELPHKVGDIALLVKSGYSERKATFIVVGTSSISIVGLVIGCFTASKFDSASQWIQLFTAGMFIYISLVLMMSQMLNAISKPDLHVSVIILAHFLGMTLGFLIMYLLTRMEHSH